MKISIYKRISDTKSQDTIDLEMFLDNIKSGQYWEHVAKVRNAETKEEKTKLKKEVPCVCVSGEFSERMDSKLVEHSGFICIDIDNENSDHVKELLAPDQYVYSAFQSISGEGAAVVFRIDKRKHREAFKAISNYLYKDYNLVADQSCINESRARMVSHDPDIYINKNAKKWTEYLPKEKTEPKISKTIYVKSDFDRIIQNIAEKRVDIAGNYDNWLHIGFALVDKFGEGGREYFRIISQYRDGDKARTEGLIDKQYDACLKSVATKSKITIATLYYFAKNAGIETYSIETREVMKLARLNKKAGGDDIAVIENLKEHTNLDHDIIEQVVPQVSDKDIPEDYTLIDIVVEDLGSKFEIRRNLISRNLEIKKNHQPYVRMDNIEYNSMFLTLKRNYDKLSFDLFERIIMSDSTKTFNPFLIFFEQYQHLKPKGNIKKLSDCIYSDFGLTGEKREYFITKWLLGMVSSMHGQHSPLMMVLTGEEQGTGKTQYFRRLLPDELQPYYAESKLDSGKDDEILMTQKIIICDDEMGGKSKRESARLKELTSKQTFSLREPYGRNNVDLQRIAVLCGTSNDNEVLNDPTGNRRVIPIHVKSINHNQYNAINKIDLLMEVYWLWHGGQNHELSRQDILELKGFTGNFEEVSSEQELIFRYFKIPDYQGAGEFFTASDIIAHVDNMTRTKLTLQKTGQILKKFGAEEARRKRNKIDQRGYILTKVDFNQEEEIDQKVDRYQSEKTSHEGEKADPEVNNFLFSDFDFSKEFGDELPF